VYEGSTQRVGECHHLCCGYPRLAATVLSQQFRHGQLAVWQVSGTTDELAVPSCNELSLRLSSCYVSAVPSCGVSYSTPGGLDGRRHTRSSDAALCYQCRSSRCLISQS